MKNLLILGTATCAPCITLKKELTKLQEQGLIKFEFVDLTTVDSVVHDAIPLARTKFKLTIGVNPNIFYIPQVYDLETNDLLAGYNKGHEIGSQDTEQIVIDIKAGKL